jgi:hypothetical protein
LARGTTLAARPPHFAPRARAVIHIFANGGPSHLDTFDRKPLLEARLVSMELAWRMQFEAGEAFDVTREPQHVHDLQATMLHILGLDHTKLTYQHSGRDFRLTDVQNRDGSDFLRTR